jgi:hypothetical protein
MKTKIILPAFALLLAVGRTSAFPPVPHAMTYHEIDRGVEKTARFTIVRDRAGFHVFIVTTTGKAQIREELLCDSAWRTSWWRFQGSDSTTITSQRSGNVISLEGVLHGRPVSRKLSIDAHPWYQLVTMGMEIIAADSAANAEYWAVSIEGIAELKAAPFRVAGIADTSLPGHPEIHCRRVRVRLAGLFGRFWEGSYFVRLDNGRFIHFEGVRFGSKNPAGTIDVVQ